jgi:hypothetical protein
VPDAPARAGFAPAMTGGCKGGGIRLEEPAPIAPRGVTPAVILRVFEALFD